jgi:hypothetical protein
MRRNLKFLMQAFVCLLVVNLWFAPASHAGNTADLNDVSMNETTTANASSLSTKQLQVELAEAKQLLQRQNSASNSSVALAAFDRSSSQIHVVSLDKDSFLTKGGEFLLHSQNGSDLRVRIVRPNGVNTAVTVKDARTGTSMYPLTVKYPIEKDGRTETAYYVSAHPALISPDLEAAGRTYVMTMLNQAAQSLTSKGVNISPDTVAEAAHLVVVEHTDHKRFLSDERDTISTEVLCLYALNRGDTFRYSVSSAGAGGMIQMIPRTYEAIRQHHPNVGLESDFITAMQDHSNALKAMLLYINDTWNYLEGVPEVQQALNSGTATKTELLAAGYNSNPYKLSSYLTNGGSGWRTLIPAETQMYLAIYKSVDTNVDFANYDTTAVNTDGAPASQTSASIAQAATSGFVSWVGKALLSKAAMLTHLVP